MTIVSFQTVVYRCPLCAFSHRHEIHLPPATSSVLVAQECIARNRRDFDQVERALERHLATHAPIEWLRKIAALEQEVLALGLGSKRVEELVDLVRTFGAPL